MKRVVRECRYGHGTLDLLAGSFSLAGLLARNPLEALTKPQGRTRVPDGRVLAVKVWRCPECGYVELFDEDSAP